MNDPQALFYLLLYTSAAVVVANFSENAHCFIDAEKVNEPVTRKEQALPLKTDKKHADCNFLNHELKVSDTDIKAVTCEGTLIISDSTYQDRVLRFDFNDIDDVNGFVFEQNSDSHPLLIQLNSQGNLHNYSISRVHFHIHFNLKNEMLMLTDSLIYDILIESARLKWESTSLLLNTTVYYDQERHLGFLIQLQNYTEHKEIYAHNYQMYVVEMSCSSNLHLSTLRLTLSQVHNETDTQLIISKYKKNTMKKKRRALYKDKKVSALVLKS